MLSADLYASTFSTVLVHESTPTCRLPAPHVFCSLLRLVAPTHSKLTPAKGDDITFDYGTSEEHDQPWTCACGTALCRKKITANDWQRPELVARYDRHFLKHIQAKVDAARASA
jgi:hypothetical protein